MKRRYAVVMAVLFLAGCATAKPVMGPNGGKAYIVQCGSAGMEFCYEKAAEVCPAGYVLSDKRSGFGYVDNTMLIECKTPTHAAGATH